MKKTIDVMFKGHNITLTGEYTPGTPEQSYALYGDGSHEGDGDDFEIDSIFLGATDCTELLRIYEDELIELVCTEGR